MTQLRSIWSSLNASYWFYPGLGAFGALLLALFTVWLDHAGHAAWLDDVTVVEMARPDGARAMLTVIAGSMIAVASTVFSITIAAVVYASGNYGPRLLNNFMEDRGNQLSLTTFIATFVYAVTVLRTVRDGDDNTIPAALGDPLPGFVPQLSLLVAYALMALSIMVLVYFLNHIPASIRINTVLEGIGERLLHDIKEVFANKHTNTGSRSDFGGDPVAAHDVGYIRIIDLERLQRIAREHEGRIALAVRTGDFVHPNIVLAHWHTHGSHNTPPVDDLRGCFTLAGMRTADQDIHFLFDELVEIGVRALSPGINDPFTAVTVLHWLGAAMAEMGRRDLRRRIPALEGDKEARVLLLDDDFAHYLARGFGSMRTHVAASPIAALVMFETLCHAMSTIMDPARRRALLHEGDRLMRQARLVLEGPALEMVEARHREFSAP